MRTQMLPCSVVCTALLWKVMVSGVCCDPGDVQGLETHEGRVSTEALTLVHQF